MGDSFGCQRLWDHANHLAAPLFSNDFATADVWLEGSRIAQPARVGIGNFGAHVYLTNTTFECTNIPLNGEVFHGYDFLFEGDQETVACYCAGTTSDCQVMSTDLEAPGALPPL